MYNAKVLVKTKPGSWSEATYLLRCIEEDGNESMLTVTGDAALAQFDNVEEDRVYNFEIPGTCVKANTTADKNGFDGNTEVKLQSPIKLQVAKEAWPTKVQYDPTPFINLTQVELGTWVDVVGTVQRVDAANILQPRTVTLQSGEFHETLELQGHETLDKASLTISIGDVLAVRGCTIIEYEQGCFGVRVLSTGFLTYIEANPRNNETVIAPATPEAGTPTKKAIKNRYLEAHTLEKHIVKDMVTFVKEFLNQFRSGQVGPYRQRYIVLGKIDAFDLVMTHWPRNSKHPFFAPELDIQLFADISDDTGTMRVQILHEAAQNFLQTDAETLRGLWQSRDTAIGRAAFLGELNKDIEHAFNLFCIIVPIKFWFCGIDHRVVQIFVARMERPSE